MKPLTMNSDRLKHIRGLALDETVEACIRTLHSKELLAEVDACHAEIERLKDTTISLRANYDRAMRDYHSELAALAARAVMVLDIGTKAKP